jgi:hypothetical protein
MAPSLQLMKIWNVTPLVDTLSFEGHKLQNPLSFQPIWPLCQPYYLVTTSTYKNKF